jgi:hypothetical protein
LAAEPAVLPPRPEPTEPDANWEHLELWKSVTKALYTLPSTFQSELVISGVLATDLFAFNSSLGATIEEQVIASLNKLRSVWDPEQKYALWSFERQPQTFPDVVLRTSAPDVEPKILMGIELKGWYALAKEREPSFRYKVTPAVCAPQDLLVVVPWALSKVISGSPQVFTPFVMGARHAAETRNWYWQHSRVDRGGARGITLSQSVNHYPSKADPIGDVPEADSGNFGRLARAGVMEQYISELFDDKLSGIPLLAWQKFLGLFTESQTSVTLERGLSNLARAYPSNTAGAERAEAIRAKLAELALLIAAE